MRVQTRKEIPLCFSAWWARMLRHQALKHKGSLSVTDKATLDILKAGNDY